MTKKPTQAIICRVRGITWVADLYHRDGFLAELARLSSPWCISYIMDYSHPGDHNDYGGSYWYDHTFYDPHPGKQNDGEKGLNFLWSWHRMISWYMVYHLLVCDDLTLFDLAEVDHWQRHLPIDSPHHKRSRAALVEIRMRECTLQQGVPLSFFFQYSKYHSEEIQTN